MHLDRHGHERTCAGLDALGPSVINAVIAALVDPSTSGSATAAFAGFLDSAALGARTRIDRSWSHRVCF